MLQILSIGFYFTHEFNCSNFLLYLREVILQFTCTEDICKLTYDKAKINLSCLFFLLTQAVLFIDSIQNSACYLYLCTSLSNTDTSWNLTVRHFLQPIH